ncbi:MAG TPA: ATP-dependent DNA helicase RecG, partial [Candidatus Eisenbacteria bacterium]|nr:ATP-dependent DNA helicase RecG [Candidatus Eisenbacteria bacterium]
MVAIWFNQPYLANSLKEGEEYRFAGKAVKTKFGLRLANPLYEPLGGGRGLVRPLMPVYSLPAGVSQFVMRKLVAACKGAIEGVIDPLPQALRKTNDLVGKVEAVRGAHFPETLEQRDAARRRLAFDEVLALQLAIGRTKRLRRSKKAVPVPFDEEGTKAFVRSLPFTLTDDQRKAAWAALKDMAGDTPMHRLLDGDVGSGKTAVAAIAMVNAARAGLQSALMAPTEILARQHFETFKRFFAGQGLTIALWTNAYRRSATGGKEIDCATKKDAENLRNAIAAGEADAIIGTHALVEEKLRFSSLAFAAIDEQHRFGVRTRQLLCTKSGMPGSEPHLLSMTATPIPRSLALTAFGDLDLSILREKPKGRQDIATRVLGPRIKHEAYARIRDEVAAGRQAFVICPLIDPSDALGIESVTEAFKRLKKEEFPDATMGMLHGKLTSDEKESVMRDFAEGTTSILVSTSVVEVGVDVPNATVMCIEGAERFGLSQLHQFRGRVGRGEHRSSCFLLPSFSSPATDERLSAMTTHADGFTLAEKDLALRGPGDMLGVAQSGHPALRMASLADLDLIAAARDAATSLLDADPELVRHKELRAYLAEEIEDAHLE